MKIAMIGHKRIPSREGGVEIVVEKLSTKMAKKNHTVDVYNRKEKSFKEVDNYKGVNIITVPTINKKSLDALIYSFVATIKAIFKRYDVIHYHALGPSVMLIIPHILGIKTVATVHGLDWQRGKWGGFASKYLKFGEKIIAKYADEVIVLSENVQKYFKDTYGRDTHYIQNGVEIPEHIEPEIIKEKYNLNGDDYILYLGRIVPEKGIHYLIEAFKQIKTDKKLVIAGGSSHTNEYYEKIKSMAKEDSRIIMTGFVQGKLLEELFSNCNLYILPSDIEGMPISLLEAMSYGKVCLVSNIKENLEVIKKNGISFEKSNIDDLMEKLNSYLNENSFNLDKAELIDYIKDNFNWDDVVDETLKLYE